MEYELQELMRSIGRGITKEEADEVLQEYTTVRGKFNQLMAKGREFMIKEETGRLGPLTGARQLGPSTTIGG